MADNDYEPDCLVQRRIEGAPDLVDIHQEVRQVLRGINDHVLADAALVVVMLAGDAHRHGTPPVTLRIRRTSDDHLLRIEVDDHRPETAEPVPKDYRSHLLDRMTSTRGVDHHDDLTTTWAEIPLAPEVIAS